MKTWVRITERVRLCGMCGKVLVKGTPALEVTFGPQAAIRAPLDGADRPSTWTQTRVRCEACAGCAAPSDLPEPEASKQTPITPTRKSSVRPLKGLADQFRRTWSPYKEDIA